MALEHGTRGCYVHNGCRRPECVEANRVYIAQFRAETGRTKNPGSRGTREHGTRSCYAAGCRREECVEANRKASREWAAARRAKLAKTTS